MIQVPPVAPARPQADGSLLDCVGTQLQARRTRVQRPGDEALLAGHLTQPLDGGAHSQDGLVAVGRPVLRTWDHAVTHQDLLMGQGPERCGAAGPIAVTPPYARRSGI